MSTSALTFEEARQMVIETARTYAAMPATEQVDLQEASGRVLAEPVRADRDYPPVRRSLRDGFAVRAADLPGKLRVTGEIRAGLTGELELKPSSAIEIMTGAPVPRDADAVVMVEHVSREGEFVSFSSRPAPGQFVNEQGSEAKQGAELIRAGTRLDACHIAALAMTGHVKPSVYKQLSVAILSTGDELVSVETNPMPHQVRNSNSYALAAQVRAAGATATILPVAKDEPNHLRALVSEGLQHDLLLISGGVSAGKYDFVKAALDEHQGRFFFTRVKIQPGQPTVFGAANGKLFFGLPGNPASTLVTFQLFARAALEILSGQAEPRLPLLQAKLREPFHHKPGLTRFLPAVLDADGSTVSLVKWQGSSDIPSLAKANVFAVIDADRESWEAGEPIRVMLRT